MKCLATTKKATIRSIWHAAEGGQGGFGGGMSMDDIFDHFGDIFGSAFGGGGLEEEGEE